MSYCITCNCDLHDSDAAGPADAEVFDYAVVEFSESNSVGVTATKWLTEDKEHTIWPKKSANERKWLLSLKYPRTPAEVARSWIKLKCKVQTYAGM